MTKKTLSTSVEFILAIIDQAYDHKSWHGTNLRGAIRGLSAKTAAWRPNPKRHNIWEIVSHAAYWKYAVRRRLSGEARGSFPLKGSNWFMRPQELTEAAWKADIKLLEDTHQALRAAIAGLAPSQLWEIPPGSKLNNFTVLTGIAAHDLYHAGQIQLLKRLAAGR